jgi:starch synthase
MQHTKESSRWLGLPPHDSMPDIFEDYGRMNFLKTGIHFADVVNTVSPDYAREIRASGSGQGLGHAISNKGERFRGILNGVDYDTWSPEKDVLIPALYSVEDMSGKIKCKMHLQGQFHLEENARIALIGFIGRLARQKGVHLLKEVIERVVTDMVVQVVMPDSGDPGFEEYFGACRCAIPERSAHISDFTADWPI